MQSAVPVMTPAAGERCQRFVGDTVRFSIQDRGSKGRRDGWRALLRTNLGRGEQLRREILEAHTAGLALAGASWRDLPMTAANDKWNLELPLSEVGFFKAKAYLLDPRGWQHWPADADVTIAVHPNRYRTANILYCAFPRLFGDTKAAKATRPDKSEATLRPLDAGGYSIIPPSGKLRDLTRQLSHIFRELGCRILHLLPVHPTPTTYARFGRFGSPYAALELSSIDPALVVFDRRSTGIDQFRDLTYRTHLEGGRVFLDIVINHTGWGSALQENHPDWFLRQADGTFTSPGAWGTIWEDLVELKHQNVELWDELSEMFLTWCRRGVDGFRCDAGYMVPVPAWQYIVARVQQEYPETLFLLEGLGGAWETTEALLSEGGMQWAYSELFQNDSGLQVAGYLDHSIRQNGRVGLLVHYSETHDNNRLAARGHDWSLLRNRLCGLTSVSGGFGFTCGVEWLATEKILVHGCTGLAWDNKENLVPELAKLNRLLTDHPCFFDGAKLTRLSLPDSPVYALWRESEEGKDAVLVLVNTDAQREHSVTAHPPRFTAGDLAGWVDLLGQKAPALSAASSRNFLARIPAGGAYCLASTSAPQGLHGEEYRHVRARAAWGLTALARFLPLEAIGPFDWRALATQVDRSPADFLARVAGLPERRSSSPNAPILDLLGDTAPTALRVVTWRLGDLRRITPVPPGQWLLLEDTVPFRARLSFVDGSPVQNVESIAAHGGYYAAFAPRQTSCEATVVLERHAEKDSRVEAPLRFLAPEPIFSQHAIVDSKRGNQAVCGKRLVLLTNGRGGMARIPVDLGRVMSKYDCVLGANLHPTLPVDRHVLAKRIRVWVNADGFISPLDIRNLSSFESGPPARWHFVALAGDGRTVEIQVGADMVPGRNTTLFQFSRPAASQATGKQLPDQADVRLTVRLDIEDRNFHWETERNGGAEHHFASHVRSLEKPAGFKFTPAHDRQLRVFVDSGAYHPQPEWSENLPHPVEQSRGQTGSGDAYSPGWFELPLPKGASVTLVVTAEPADPGPSECEAFRTGLVSGPATRRQIVGAAEGKSDKVRSGVEEFCGFEQQLLRAIRVFVVQRGEGKTVIAGYPWFLDWGRDTFICARGLLAAGMIEEVKQLLVTFGRFEKDGTLPNTIFGENASNRDTSDAPLWFGLVCEELAAIYRVTESEKAARALYDTRVDKSGRTLREVLASIASHYVRGTPNGIHMDAASGLIWSPSHFTWMDTNYPAGTPREGFPVEIQALWIRLLRQLNAIGGGPAQKDFDGLAERALDALERLFWRKEPGYYSDVLLAGRGQPAAEARADDALRSNCLFVASLGLAGADRARACVEAALRFLVVPGALRTLAPLPVSVPLPIHAADGRPLNNPREPYWGHYEGDEDTRRKPAYHNGTAWTWTFPTFCEALARAWDFTPEAVATARAYLGSMDRLMSEGCLGHIPEIIDGDVPHTQRGCDAQAWGATEALRVWKLLNP